MNTATTATYSQSLPKRVVKSYLTQFGYKWVGKRQRRKAEKILFAQGYRVVEEEPKREFGISFLGTWKKLKVTYELA